ncbi:MAG: LamG-like jellyroll fold domain-containing protein [Nitrospirota bacterium]
MRKRRKTLYYLVYCMLLMNIIAAGTASAVAVCPSEMLHYWKLDEGSAPYDDFYGTNNATCTVCPSPVAGRVNGAQQFTATTNVSAVDDGTFDWDNSQSFSVEVWMKTASCSGTDVLVGRDDSATPVHWWVGCTNGIAEAYLIDSNNNGYGVGGTTLLTDNSWHHLVFVRNAAANTISLYVDGQLEDSVSTAYTGTFNSTAALNFGWLNLSTGYHFSGALDEIALYNRALPLAEISQHYKDGSIGLRWGYCACSSPVRIMQLGDSITFGEPPYDPILVKGFRQPLYQSLTDAGYSFDFVGSMQDGDISLFDIDHEGHGGWAAKRERPPYGGGIAPYVQGILTTNPADVVLLHIGTNDVSDGLENANDVAEILDNIDILSNDIVVVLSKIIRRTDDKAVKTTLFNNAVGAMATTRIASGDRIVVVDHENALNYSTDMASVLHPNQTGYNKMANVWFNALRAFLPVCAEPAMPPCPSEMLHYWKLDEGSAPYDDFYGTNNATCTVCPSPVAGRVNGAQQFTATTNVSAVDDGTFDWDNSQSFSVEVWMKTASCSGTDVLVGRDDSATPVHWWVGCTNGIAEAYLIDSNNNGYGVGGTTLLTDNSWHHLVFVRNAAANTISLYVDGQLEDSVSTAYTGTFNSTAALNFGWLNLSTGYHFSGALDEIALYNRALPLAEISQHYSNGLNGFGYCTPTFTVTGSAPGGHGTISCVPSTVNSGASSTCTMTPDANYHLSALTDNGTNVLGSVVNNQYTIFNITANHTVVATFAINTYTLTVAKSGKGNGTVTSIPSGINCGGDCSEAFNTGTSVTLIATASSDSNFTGWNGGGCTGTGNCTVIMNSAVTVTASFDGKYFISGTVRTPSGSTPGSPIRGVTITLGGDAGGTAITDKNGYYQFAGLPNGNYTLTPSMLNYSFTPATRAVALSERNMYSQNFTGTYSVSGTHSLSGKILTAQGSPLSGVTVALNGSATGTTQTDILGNYTFSGLSNGNYTVTPGMAGYTFAPEFRTVTISGFSMSGMNFTGTLTGGGIYSISGTVRLPSGAFPGKPVPGVVVSLTGDSTGTTTTDNYGNYTFRSLPNGNFTIAPSKTGYTFTPTERNVTIDKRNLYMQDFTAVLEQ